VVPQYAAEQAQIPPRLRHFGMTRYKELGKNQTAGLLPAASFCEKDLSLICCQHPPKRSLDGAPNSSRILTHLNRCVEMAWLG